VSYSFQEPEWPAVCECKYDEARDEMDREDCQLHCDGETDSPAASSRDGALRRPARNAKGNVTESAA